jgi:hypothetical protein
MKIGWQKKHIFGCLILDETAVVDFWLEMI